MKPQTSYRYIQDPGHGWIEVPRAELAALAIVDLNADLAAADAADRALALAADPAALAILEAAIATLDAATAARIAAALGGAI